MLASKNENVIVIVIITIIIIIIIIVIVLFLYICVYVSLYLCSNCPFADKPVCLKFIEYNWVILEQLLH